MTLADIIGHRMAALLKKEFGQIRRDRRFAISLVVPPTLQLLLFGFALNATVDHLKLGIVDLSQTSESRDLVASLTESGAFARGGTYFSSDSLGTDLARGKLDAGIVIPTDFAKDIRRHRQTTVQFLLNAMNANTASIAQGYAEGVLQNFNQGLLVGQFQRLPTAGPMKGRVALISTFLFNPGLINEWYTVTGTFGLLLVLNGSLIASASMVKEREAGTVEQLLMTPAGTGEIIAAKITPLFMLLCCMALFATLLLKVVFQVPFRGNVLLVLVGAALCLLCGIGIGTTLSTFSKSAQQAQLMAFFVNPPLSSFSGALTPVEAMPKWMQPVTQINPIRHFSLIARGVFLKGSGLDVLWPHMVILVGLALFLLSVSVWRFRKQLG
jgi:ABC-2 type transport system permease protein